MTRLDFQSLRQHKKRVLTRPTVSGTAAPEVGKKKYDWLRGRRSSLTDPGSVFAHAASGRHMNELTGVLGTLPLTTHCSQTASCVSFTCLMPQ